MLVRNADVELVVRLGDVVRGVTTTVEFGDDSAPVDNVTLSVDDVEERGDRSANYRYRAVVSHRYSCAGRYRLQLTVRTLSPVHTSNYVEATLSNATMSNVASTLLPFWQQCRSNVRLCCHKRQSCLLLRQCCFAIVASVDRALIIYNNNNRDDIYGAVIMAKPLREFTRFI